MPVPIVAVAFAFFLSPLVSGDWEIGVATEHQVELLSSDGQVVSMAARDMLKTNALTYDPIYDNLYFSDLHRPNISIYIMEVSKDGRTSNAKPLVKKTGQIIEAITHDPISSTLFWTTGFEKTIMSAPSFQGETLSNPKLVHEFDFEIPKGIAVDPCKRRLYWTNCNVSNATIEMSSLTGGNRTLLFDDLYLPVSITISQSERMIYWVEIGRSHYFSIKKAPMEGGQFEKVVEARGQHPLSIAVSHLGVYWTDMNEKSIWTFVRSNSLTPNVTLKVVKKYVKTVPKGLSAISQYDNLDERECKNLIDLKTKVPDRFHVSLGTCLNGFLMPKGDCICVAGYTGRYCEVDLCHNYCMGGGICTLSPLHKPRCSCTEMRTGSRCEVELCPADTCTNNGTCLLTEYHQPMCSCPNGFYGNKCHLTKSVCQTYCSAIDKSDSFFDDCPCENLAVIIKPEALQSNSSSMIMKGVLKDWQMAFWILVGAFSFAMLALIVLIHRVWVLKARPKLIRRYQVTPHKTTDQCEIAIENCCNMNICETPCYEPELRTPKTKGKKEEKRNLLCNIEVQPDGNSGGDIF